MRLSFFEAKRDLN